MKYAFIKEQSQHHRKSLLFQVMNVSSSGYYDWLSRPESMRSIESRQITARIHLFHQASRGTYGSPRIHKDLVESGTSVGVNRVATLMRTHGIQSKMARKFIITTDSKKTLSPAPDRLRQQFTVSGRNKAWVSDTTFIATREGWLYLAVILDLFSRRVIGWSMSDKNNTALVEGALIMAILRRGKSRGTIVHSDQGSTYASAAYQQLLATQGYLCSMSRKGECLDNAVAESFFGSLKTELADHEDYKTRDQAKQSLFEYIEVFYNQQRRHSYLDYVSPQDHERKHAYN